MEKTVQNMSKTTGDSLGLNSVVSKPKATGGYCGVPKNAAAPRARHSSMRWSSLISRGSMDSFDQLIESSRGTFEGFLPKGGKGFFPANAMSISLEFASTMVYTEPKTLKTVNVPAPVKYTKPQCSKPASAKTNCSQASFKSTGFDVDKFARLDSEDFSPCTTNVFSKMPSPDSASKMTSPSEMSVFPQFDPYSIPKFGEEYDIRTGSIARFHRDDPALNPGSSEQTNGTTPDELSDTLLMTLPLICMPPPLIGTWGNPIPPNEDPNQKFISEQDPFP